jgi:phage-related holin
MITEVTYMMSCPPWISKIMILIIAYFTPIKEMVNVMLIFLLIDLISGIWAAVKEKQQIQSAKLRRSITKFLWYTVAVMVAFMMETTFNLTWTNLANIIAGFICIVELISIFENITRITREPLFLRLIKMIRKRCADTIHEVGDILESEKKTNTNQSK